MMRVVAAGVAVLAGVGLNVASHAVHGSAADLLKWASFAATCAAVVLLIRARPKRPWQWSTLPLMLLLLAGWITFTDAEELMRELVQRLEERGPPDGAP